MIKSSDIKRIYDAALNGGRQRVTISVSTVHNEDTILITEGNIVAGTFSIDRYVSSGDCIQLGSVVAAELKLTLDNSNHIYDDVVFEGARLIVNLHIQEADGGFVSTKIGKFTVDEHPRNLSAIELTALDDMVRFDKDCDISSWDVVSMRDLLIQICDKADVPYMHLLNEDMKSIRNMGYIPSGYPEDGKTTLRQVLAWICQITGTCAYIDEDGDLALDWYEDAIIPGDTAKFTIKSAYRYSSDYLDAPVVVRDINIYEVNSEEPVVLRLGDVNSEVNAYALNIKDNPFVTDANKVKEGLAGFSPAISYVPFSASCISMPFLRPLDMVKFEDVKTGKLSDTLITNHTFKLNGTSELKGKGESTVKSGYASANPLTSHEASVINSLKNNLREELNSRFQEVLRLNENMNNAFGLYSTIVEDEQGRKTYFYHDTEQLIQGCTVYMMNSNGTAWTDNYIPDNPNCWTTITDKKGSILAAYLNTKGIDAERISVSTPQVVNSDGSLSNVNVATILLELGMIQFKINEEEPVVVIKDEGLKAKNADIESKLSLGNFNFKSDYSRGAVTMSWDEDPDEGTGGNTDNGEEI